jgi:hypothetical protein
VVTPAGVLNAHLRGNADSNAIEPVTQMRFVFKLTGLASQHHESGLENILGICLAAEYSLAHAQHQAPLSIHKLGKTVGITMSRVLAEKHGIASSLPARDAVALAPIKKAHVSHG